MTELQSLLDELTSGDDVRAEAAIAGLASLTEAALTPLLLLLDSPINDHRWWATRALAALDKPDAWEGILKSLEDPDPAIRQCAALGCLHRPTPQAVGALSIVLNDTDPLAARLAADALAAIGPVAIPALTEAMQSSNPSVRIEATRAMTIIQNPQTIPALFTALEDPSPLVCHWAEAGLERLGIGMMFFKP